jgi:L-ascorbate metabolism protein UlaG (beta-lactamase superfamily)
VATPSTTVIAPGAVVEKMPEADRGRVTVLANGAATNWQGLTIEAVPMYNLDSEKQAFHPKGRGNGYVVSDGSTRIYISGDTEDIPEMRTLEDIDIAFVCMNLPYTMDVAAAADAVREFEPKIVFPYHFRGTDGMSDIDKFSTLVAVNPAIDVRVLAWY